jgi:mannose-6-phosphate isomerase-like protein (cupin superfamily)
VILTRSSVSPIDFGGLRIFDYSAGRNWSSSIAAIEVAPGAQHAEAWSRRSDKYYLVTRGELRFVLDRSEYLLRVGDLCFVQRGQRFSYSNASPEPATLVLVHTPSFELNDEVFVEPPRT